MAVIPIVTTTSATGELVHRPQAAVTAEIKGVALRNYIPQSNTPTMDAVQTAGPGAVGDTTTVVTLANFAEGTGIAGVTVAMEPAGYGEFSFEATSEGVVTITHQAHVAGESTQFSISYQRTLTNPEAAAYMNSLSSADGIKVRPTNVTATFSDDGTEIIVLKNGPHGGFVQNFTPSSTVVTDQEVNTVVSAILT